MPGRKSGSANGSQFIPKDFWQDFATRWGRKIYLLLGAAGIILLIAGVLLYYYRAFQKTSGETLGVAGDSGEKEDSVFTRETTISVHIDGAVEKPGVYEVPNDSRIQNVLITAGGLLAKADRVYLSKSINLAQRVVDGQKIYIPFTGEGKTAAPDSVSHLVNLNTASSAGLEALPGIGPVTAGKIIAGRPYQNISELVNRKVISSSVFNKIKDQVSVD
jgi:competence protein ComEA